MTQSLQSRRACGCGPALSSICTACILSRPRHYKTRLERDVELVLVGVEIKSTGRPSVVLGDLNDVAWSPTTAEFARAGDLRDPRRGRGFFNTYPARLPGLRYPLDYVFHTKHFSVCKMRVLPKTGSDHLPLIAVLDLHPNGTAPPGPAKLNQRAARQSAEREKSRCSSVMVAINSWVSSSLRSPVHVGGPAALVALGPDAQRR